MNKAVAQQLEKAPNRKVYLSTIAIILTALIIWSFMGVNITGFDQQGMRIARNIFRGLFSPDLEFLFDFTSGGGVPGLLFETIAIAFLGTVFGSFLAIPISFLMSPSIVSRPVAFVTRLVVIFIRTIPPAPTSPSMVASRRFIS